MPKTFRREFRTQGCTAHIRKRKSGPYNWNYEVRFRKFGYNIAVSSNNLAEAKQKFIAKLNEVDRFGSAAPSIPSTFDSFANYYFENFYKRKVAAETYRIGLNQYKNHILPNFGNVSMRKITPKACQDILDRLQGKDRRRRTFAFKYDFQSRSKAQRTHQQSVRYGIPHKTRAQARFGAIERGRKAPARFHNRNTTTAYVCSRIIHGHAS